MVLKKLVLGIIAVILFAATIVLALQENNYAAISLILFFLCIQAMRTKKVLSTADIQEIN